MMISKAMPSFEWFEKELSETNEKLKKEEFENKQLKELIISLALEIKMLRDTLEHLNNSELKR